MKRFFTIIFGSLLLFLVACGDGAQGDDNVSSMFTDSSNDQYPHTKPIRIQEAKYKFVVNDGMKSNNTTQQQQAQQRNQQQSNLQNRKQANQTPQQPRANNQQQAPNQTAQNNNISQTERRVVELTNQERRKQGLPDLQMDTKLSSVAKEKAVDMQRKGYFSHTSPTYGSPFDMMRDFGVTYQAAGENIAQGQQTPEEVVQAWMNSEGHRRNILNAEFTHIGVGHETTANHWSQMFIKK